MFDFLICDLFIHHLVLIGNKKDKKFTMSSNLSYNVFDVIQYVRRNLVLFNNKDGILKRKKYDKMDIYTEPPEAHSIWKKSKKNFNNHS